MIRRLSLLVLLFAAAKLSAQNDSSLASRIMLGVHGGSNAQPGLVVLSGPGLDSVRQIVQRDLSYSDRFAISPLLDSVGRLQGAFDPNTLKGLGLTWIVELEPAVNGVDVKLYDAATALVKQQMTMAADVRGVGDGRLSVHKISDQIVSWTGGTGIAATRIAFTMSGKEIWRVDADGANLTRMTPAATIALGVQWSPDGQFIAYSEVKDAVWVIYLQRVSSGTRNAVPVVPSASTGNSNSPSFSPDGHRLVYSHVLDRGYDIETVDISHMCCAQRLTRSGALADNVTPTYSPDGHRIVFVSKRTGTTQIWVMDDDGTGQRQLIESQFDAGARPLAAYKPSYSPDGARLVFARDMPGGSRQLFMMGIAGGSVTQLTNQATNEDASWAADSRHIVFKSRRTGREQLWILDTVTGSSRQLPTSGPVQTPSWSPSLVNNP